MLCSHQKPFVPQISHNMQGARRIFKEQIGMMCSYGKPRVQQIRSYFKRQKDLFNKKITFYIHIETHIYNKFG